MKKHVLAIIASISIIVLVLFVFSWLNDQNRFPKNLLPLTEKIAANTLGDNDFTVEDTTYHPSFETRRQLTIGREKESQTTPEERFIEILGNVSLESMPSEITKVNFGDNDLELLLHALEDSNGTNPVLGCYETTSGSVSGRSYTYCSKSFSLTYGNNKILYVDVVVDTNTRPGFVREHLIFTP